MGEIATDPKEMSVEDLLRTLNEQNKAMLRTVVEKNHAELDRHLEVASKELMEAHKEAVNEADADDDGASATSSRLSSSSDPGKRESASTGIENVGEITKDERNDQDDEKENCPNAPRDSDSSSKKIGSTRKATQSANIPPSTTKKQKKGNASTKATYVIKVEAISGPHSGNTYMLKPRTRAPCFVGRSTGKKFQDRGISLPEDSEVSTTHAKFELKKGTLHFTDNGSTNGSFVDGEALEVGKPLELYDDLVIRVGSTDLKVSLLFDE